MIPLALTEELAVRFARIALAHVRREYPNKPGHVLEGPEDALAPRALHPVFYGSFDWHSCVHGYWMLARLLSRHPRAETASATISLFDEQLVEEKIAGECAYLMRPSARGFERPYGWAWLLKFAAELSGLEGGRWSTNMQPLAALVVERLRDYLPLATYPVRSGAHFNTAFALRLAADYAEIFADAPLLAELRQAAARWYGGDLDCPAWGEPGGDDFLSPTLIEAECMRRLFPREDFLGWLDRFLPRLASGAPANLFVPATVSDRADGKIAHLDGLNLSRAWGFGALARALSKAEPRRRKLEDAAARHLEAGLSRVSGDYMGEHWLASFAVLAIDLE